MKIRERISETGHQDAFFSQFGAQGLVEKRSDVVDKKFNTGRYFSPSEMGSYLAVSILIRVLFDRVAR